MDQTIYVDNREDWKVQRIAQQHWGDRVKFASLVTGDYICGDVCIERKTVGDFLQSFMNGRLQNQVQKMRANFNKCYIIVVGSPADAAFVNWSSDAFEKKLWSFSLENNIKIGRATSEKMFMHLATIAFEKSSDTDYVAQGLKRVTQRTNNVYVDMLMCVDGIGEKKARTVLDKIPLDKLWDSSIEDIQSVKGIGPKQATAIKKVFTRRSDESKTNQRRIKELSK